MSNPKYIHILLMQILEKWINTNFYLRFSKDLERKDEKFQSFGENLLP